MSRALRRAVAVAERRLKASGYADAAARQALAAAQRELAANRREQWAEAIDIGVDWAGGAPLPHVVSNGSNAVLFCYESVSDPEWDGTTVSVVDPSAAEPSALLRFTFESCHSLKFGGPNDEVLHGHPLYERGLLGYGPYVVHNSRWLAEEERINSVHSYHRGDWQKRLNHYFFVFHDEMFEALAEDFKVDRVQGALRDLMPAAALGLVVDD